MRYAWTAVFLTALAVRLVCVSDFRQIPFFTDLIVDSKAYDLWAQRIASGEVLGKSSFYQAPLYPYLLGTVYAAFGRDLLLVRVLQCVMGAASCVLLGVEEPGGSVARARPAPEASWAGLCRFPDGSPFRLCP